MENLLLILLVSVLCLSGLIIVATTIIKYFSPKFSDTEGQAVLNIETYIDGQNQPTHPSVLDLGKQWNGYRYWMAYSPYPYGNGAEENPCVCVSNDMFHWTTPCGLHNPIADNEETGCDELKDPHIVFNKDSDLIEVWYLGRIDSTIASGGKLLLFRKTSSDGVHWSEYEVMRELAGYLSPSIVCSDGVYKLWSIRASGKETVGGLFYSESADGKVWSSEKECLFGGSIGIGEVWHGAVSVDNLYRFVYIKKSSRSDSVMYCESKDGLNWSDSREIVTKKNFWYSFYRPCILSDGSNCYCIYGVITKDNERYISMSYGNTVDNLKGIAVDAVGSSQVNSDLYKRWSLTNYAKEIYRDMRYYFRPELLVFGAMTAVALLIFDIQSFSILWLLIWGIFVSRFYGNFKWMSLQDGAIMLLTTGILSVVSSFASRYLL